MFTFSLPNINEIGATTESKKIKSYLFQLTEQLRYVLNNIETENFSSELYKQFENTVTVSESLAKLDEFVEKGLNNANEEMGEIRETVKQSEQTLLNIYQELYDAIAASASEVTAKYQSEIQRLDTSISSTLQADYTLKSETASLEAQMLSKFQQTAEDMMAIFSETYTGEITDLSDFAQQFSSYIRFSLGGIELGRSDSVIVARLQNNKLSFIQKGTGGEYEVAYISDKKLYITEANITKSVTFGTEAHGFLYDLGADPLYGLTLTWRNA